MSNFTENKKYFDNCLDTAKALFDEKLYEDCALFLEKISSFAWKNFTGYYTSWELESLLNLLGNQILPLQSYNKQEKTENLSVLHIVSEIYETGGHTKLLLNWIELDKDTKHTILSTRMDKHLLSDRMNIYTLESNIGIKELKSEGLLSKAFELKQIANDYDKIILHIHPDDVIPIIALSDNEITTPVLFLNHADHIFWIGMSIIDCLIQIRESRIPIDKERRGAGFQRFLPIPINNDQKLYYKEKTKISKKENDVILLSTGSEYKYKPYKNHNFFTSALKIVESFDNVLFLIAGVSPENEYAKQFTHPRIIYLGEVKNLAHYEDLCDIYVEGFPIASFTALLQPVMRHKYIQLMYQPMDMFKLFNNNEENDLIYPESFDEWFKQLSIAIKNSNIRKKKAQKQYEYISQIYSIKNWKELLNTIYRDTNEIIHKTRKNKKDIFYLSDNECFLESLHNINISHYKYSYKLSFQERIKVIFRVKYKTNKVFVGKKETWHFLIGREK